MMDDDDYDDNNKNNDDYTKEDSIDNHKDSLKEQNKNTREIFSCLFFHAKNCETHCESLSSLMYA